MVKLEYYLPSPPPLVCVGGPEHDKTGHGTHVSELFDGLMSWAVLAQSNGIVRKHIDYRQFHQSTQAQRSAHVIDESKKARTEGSDFYQAHSVYDSTHGVFADAEMEIAGGIILRLEITGSFERKPGLSRGCQVCRSSNEPGNVLGDCVQHFSRGLASRHSFRICGEFGQITVPSFRKLAVLHAE